MDDRSADRRTRMTTRRFASAADAAAADQDFWRQIPPDERVLQVWTLSREQWRVRGDRPDESGLCRSVARVRRG
jgi:hypothetical protein